MGAKICCSSLYANQQMYVFAQVPDVAHNQHKVDELRTVVCVIFGLMRQKLLAKQSKQTENTPE